MQIYADVIGQPMLIAGSPQTPALGAALVGRGHGRRPRRRLRRLERGAGAHDDGQGEALYAGRRPPAAVYDELYALYRELHDSFGGVGRKADSAR